MSLPPISPGDMVSLLPRNVCSTPSCKEAKEKGSLAGPPSPWLAREKPALAELRPPATIKYLSEKKAESWGLGLDTGPQRTPHPPSLPQLCLAP